MPRSRAAQDRHNELRRQSRGKARKAVFITDYVQVKYPEIFKEAEGLFNVLNAKYEDKYDLRKTNEFLCFKHITEGKGNKNGKELYFDLETASVSVRKLESLPTENVTECESLPAETVMECESLPTENVTECESLPAETVMECESLPTENVTECESLPAENVTECESLPAENVTECESLPAENVTECESLPAETVTELSPVTKQLEPLLEIALIPEQQAREATVTSQTIQIMTEQETPPISFNDIPTDMIDQIISQLRQDPDLTEIFKDIEFQMEFDQLGEDLDIPQMNSLEDELFW